MTEPRPWTARPLAALALAAMALAPQACKSSGGGPAAPAAAASANNPEDLGPAARLRRPSEWVADNLERDAPEPAELVVRGRRLMGTVFKVMVPADGHDDAATKAADAVLDEAARIETMMSEWKPESPLSRVNAQAGQEPVEVPAELFEVIRRGIEISEASGGTFDVSWAALWDLWRFDRPPRVPATEEVAARRALVNYRDIVLDAAKRTVFLRRQGMLVGLGGIAKGYAVDRGAAILRERGFPNFIIYGGGQVYAGGARGARPWRVGVQDPGNPDRWFAILELRDASLSTSGDYEHFFEVDGVRYHHIVDPRTGFPARGCRSVTVLAADGTTADGLSTAAFVLGPKEGFRVLRRFRAEGIAVDEQNRVHISEGLTDRVLVGPPTP